MFSGKFTPDGMIEVEGQPYPLPCMIFEKDVDRFVKDLLMSAIEVIHVPCFRLNPLTKPIAERGGQLIEAEKTIRQKQLDEKVLDLFCYIMQDFAYYIRAKFVLGIQFEPYDLYWLKIANEKSQQLDLEKLLR